MRMSRPDKSADCTGRVLRTQSSIRNCKSVRPGSSDKAVRHPRLFDYGVTPHMILPTLLNSFPPRIVFSGLLEGYRQLIGTPDSKRNCEHASVWRDRIQRASIQGRIRLI